jgi:hypothetical protein
MTSLADVAKLFKDALDTQPTIIGKPNDDKLLALKEKSSTFCKPSPMTGLTGFIMS